MEKVTINIQIEGGYITITDNLGNESTHDFDPDIIISDQVGTYVADHMEEFSIHNEILAEGSENADYVDGYFEDDDEDFDD